jgi:hypothetical protein
MILALSGRRSNPVVSIATNWNPNSACPPGMMSRASVKSCSILVFKGVGDDGIFSTSRRRPTMNSSPNQQKAAAHPKNEANAAPQAAPNVRWVTTYAENANPMVSGSSARDASKFVISISLGVDCPVSTSRCCIEGAMSSPVERTMRPSAARLICLEAWSRLSKPS